MRKVTRIKNILNRKSTDRCGYWTGYPTDEALKEYSSRLNIKSNYLSLAKKMGDDFLWLPAESCWHSPGNEEIFAVTGGEERKTLSQPGIFAECEDVREVEAFNWPSPDNFNFSKLGRQLSGIKLAGFAAMSGMWSPFFHIVDAFFGMENYYCKMYTHPAVVDAVTEHIVEFYLEANRRCFERFSRKIDCFFMGNDLGSQRNLLISPEMFKRFVLPSIKKLTACAKEYNLPVMMHSCGAIAKVIPDLIDAGIDALHPLQAKAAGMDAESLVQYKNDLILVGGVDTQELLPFGTPEEVRAEVFRLKKIFGDGYIVSPSHESLLPNIPLENVTAMRDAAMELI